MSSTANLTTESTSTQIQENGTNSQSENNFEKLTTFKKIVYIIKNITVEPVICLYILPSLICSMAIENLQSQMACQVNLEYNETICSNEITDNNIEFVKEADIQVTGMIPWKTALTTSIPAILVLFFGSYSDRHKKRKPFLIVPFFGEFISKFFLILCVINISRWPMEIAGVAETLFSALSGGLTTLMIAVYSYIAEITTLNNRTLRIGIVYIVAETVASIPLNLDDILFRYIEFNGIFSIALVFYIIAFIYTVFYPKEPHINVDDNQPKINLCVDLFNPKHIIDTFVTLFKKRKGTERLRIILLIFTFIVILGPIYGEKGITYYFAKKQFNMDANEYSSYFLYDISMQLTGSFFAITTLSTRFKLDDLLLATIACASKIVANFLYAFSNTSTAFYFALLINIFSGVGPIVIRSIATKLVAQDELGKILSLFGICELVAPIFYSWIYSQLFNATLNTLPGAFYLLGAALLAPALFIFITMYILQKRNMQIDNKPENIQLQ